MVRRAGLLLLLLLVLVAGGRARADDDGLPPPAPAASAKVAFDPRLDGVPLSNAPNYVNPSGTCFGMAATAIANWRARARGEKRLEGDPAEVQAVAVQVAYEDKLATDLVFRAQYIAARAAGADRAKMAQRIRELIAESGPQLLVIEGMGKNHAIVAYASEEGGFAIYDPDFPGEKRHLAADAPLAKVFVVPQQAAFVARARALHDPCSDLDGQCAASFWKIDAHAARTASGVTISGSLSSERKAHGRPAILPEAVIAWANGQPLGRAVVSSSGTFSLPLPAATTGPVRLVAFGGFRGLNIAGFAPASLALPPPAASTGVVKALATAAAPSR